MISAQRQLEARSLAARLHVEVVSDPIAFAALRSDWDELVEASRVGIFCAWEWLYPWSRRLGSTRELRIIAVRTHSGQLIGLAPLSIERRRVLGRTVRRLAFLGDARVGSEYLEVIARSGFEEAIACEVAGAIWRFHDWDVLDLLDLPEESATIAAIRDEFSAGEFGMRTWQRSICPYQSFAPGETFEGYLRRTSRRENYLRRRRRLEAQPGYRIEREGDPARLALPLAEFFRLHALRWAGNSDGIAGAAVEAFHRDAVLLLAERSKVRLYTLKVDNRAVASVYGILHRGKFAFYQSGYDPEWRNQSVGLVLLGDSFRDCIESGCVEYDFLRGTEPYKLEWAAQRRRTVGLRIFRKGGAGEWLERVERAAARARRIVQSAMPDRWVETIRARRRSLAQQKSDRRGP